MASFIPNILVQSFQSAREYFTPVLAMSQFIEKGQLTPEEFIIAGDYLTRMSPGWSWARGTLERSKPYLPPDKQFLILRNIACPVRAIRIGSKHEPILDDIITDPVYDDDRILPSSPVSEDSETEEYGDILSATPAPPCVADRADRRFYEMTIVYDNYYRTPRIYLRGETHDGRPLTPGESMEDIMQDYVNKTATIESHPHTGLQYASIHPCRHAQTMKRILDTIASNNNETYPEVQFYMFIFLKFISSMVPTLDYDLTMPISTDR